MYYKRVPNTLIVTSWTTQNADGLFGWRCCSSGEFAVFRGAFLSCRHEVGDAKQSVCASVYLRCVTPNSIFIVLTQHSFDNYILGGLIPMNFLPPLNSLIQTYDYACSLDEEVMHLFSDLPWFWCWYGHVQSGNSCLYRTGPRWKAFISLRDMFHFSS